MRIFFLMEINQKNFGTEPINEVECLFMNLSEEIIEFCKEAEGVLGRDVDCDNDFDTDFDTDSDNDTLLEDVCML